MARFRHPHLAAPALMMAAGLAAPVAGPALAQADFYKGRTLTIVAGFSAGGGYDINARAVARHISRHIPGNPRVIVQNMPGAGSLSAVRALNATLPRDGTAVVIFNPGMVTRSIVEPARVKVDFSKLAWIGVVTADFRICYSYGPKGPKTFAEMMKRKEFILGSTAKGAGNYINGATLKHVFGAPIKQILGFPGSAEQRIAIERGELDGDCGSFSSIPAAWVRDKKINPFVRFTETRAPEIPESAVYIGTFARTDEQKALLNVLNAADEIGRPFIASRQVPADRIAILRKAFNATMQDKAYRADITKLGHPVHPLTGEQAEKIVMKMAGAPAAIVAKARAVFQ